MNKTQQQDRSEVEILDCTLHALVSITRFFSVRRCGRWKQRWTYAGQLHVSTIYCPSHSVIIAAKSSSQAKDTKLDMSSESSRLLIIGSFAHLCGIPSIESINSSMAISNSIASGSSFSGRPNSAFPGFTTGQEGIEGNEGKDVVIRGRLAGDGASSSMIVVERLVGRFANLVSGSFFTSQFVHPWLATSVSTSIGDLRHPLANHACPS